MVQIVNREIPGLPKIPWAKGKPTCIVLHETANNSDNGRYEGEVNYMRNHWENAFVHFFTGEQNTAMVHDPAKGGAWGAGPSMHNYGIHFELCRSSTKAGFLKAYDNWLDAMVFYAKQYGIPMNFNKGTERSGFFTHDYVRKTWGGTTHTDPNVYLAKWGVSLSQLENDLRKKYADFGKSTVNKEELTVSQVNQLEDQIAALEARLRAALEKKADKPPSGNTPSPVHAKAWTWMQEQGLMNGQRPQEPLTREQLATILYRYYQKFIENK